MSASTPKRVYNHLSCTVSTRSERISFFFGNQCETACLRHLHYSRLAVGRNTIDGSDRFSERPADNAFLKATFQSRRKSFDSTLASVRDRHDSHFRRRQNASDTRGTCFAGLKRSQRTLERIECGNYFHTSIKNSRQIQFI